MPAIARDVIVNEIINAIQESGGTAFYISKSLRSHPKEFIVNYMGKNYTLWIYIWTLTPGGRKSLPDEYRIQMTSVKPPLPFCSDGITVLMGYEPRCRVFAGFDIQKHRNFTPGSPSVQINLSTLYDAMQHGMSFLRKSNDEIAIGVRRDQFINYCINSIFLHKYGSEENLFTFLSKAVELEKIDEDDIENLSADRKRIVQEVQKFSRDSNFRKSVLLAYDNMCAVTRMQLNLVDAAHILPVSSVESSDHVSNGLALSPTFHRAFDNSLIYLDNEYFIRLNEKKYYELQSKNLISGAEDIKRFIDRRIHLPHDPRQRPNKKYIEKANKYRRIPGYI